MLASFNGNAKTHLMKIDFHNIDVDDSIMAILDENRHVAIPAEYFCHINFVNLAHSRRAFWGYPRKTYCNRL